MQRHAPPGDVVLGVVLILVVDNMPFDTVSVRVAVGDLSEILEMVFELTPVDNVLAGLEQSRVFETLSSGEVQTFFVGPVYIIDVADVLGDDIVLSRRHDCPLDAKGSVEVPFPRNVIECPDSSVENLHCSFLS